MQPVGCECSVELNSCTVDSNCGTIETIEAELASVDNVRLVWSGKCAAFRVTILAAIPCIRPLRSERVT